MTVVKDASRVPLGERLAWSPEQAAQVYWIGYNVLDSSMGDD